VQRTIEYGFELSRAANAAEAIAAGRRPQLRLFTVPRNAADVPQTDAPGTWQESTPETAHKVLRGSLVLRA